MNAPDTLPVLGKALPLPPQLPPEYPVCVGWNLVGFKSISPRLAGDYFSGISFSVIYGYKNGAYHLVQAGDKLEAGRGYWLGAYLPGIIYP
jgi:hypothetical protein